jgi:hypothetical protein
MSDYNERERASAITKEFYEEAIRFLDGKFGRGYAEKNPYQINAYMQTSATIYSSLMNTKNFQELKFQK